MVQEHCNNPRNQEAIFYQVLHLTPYTFFRFCHTVNGTACAVPRMIISLCEQHQTLNGSVNVPPVLREFLGGAEILQGKPKKLRPNLRYISSANFFDDEKVLMD